MAHSSNDRENKKTSEIKQNFLASAISDISTYIQLTDTKVSIIMGAVVAILVGIIKGKPHRNVTGNKIPLFN